MSDVVSGARYRAWQLDGAFGFEQLRLVEREREALGWGQVRVRLRAASLNFRDLLTIQGFYNPRQPLPLVPCSDGAGEVVEVGEGASRFEVGARVAPIFAQGWRDGEPSKERLGATLGGPLDGTLREEIVVDEDDLVALPDWMSFEEAACLPCAGVTAWSALVTHGKLKAGDVVLTQGTGGVSIFAIQLAKMIGARVIATSSSPDKLERLRALGASEVIDYKQDKAWGATAKKMTGGRGVDHVVEVGGAGTLAQSLRAVRIGGRISMIGVLSGGAEQINVIPILMQNICLQGIIVGHRASFEELITALSLSKVRPIISDTFELERAPEAMEHMLAGKHLGKVVITL
jgi:NADPH:quinone reductase-like Zn-dependent oxidoreductase